MAGRENYFRPPATRRKIGQLSSRSGESGQKLTRRPSSKKKFRQPNKRPPVALQRKDIGKRKREITNNALVAGVVSAIVAGIIAFLVAHFQEQDAASQAHAVQEAQAAGQLETAANALYQSSTSVYNFQLKCSNGSETRKECAALAPSLNVFSADMTTFDADGLNIADKKAAGLAQEFAKGATDTIATPSTTQAKKLWSNMLTLYLELIGRCAQLIQGS